MSQRSLNPNPPTTRQDLVLQRAARLSEALKSRARSLTPAPLARERLGGVTSGFLAGRRIEFKSRFGRLLAASFVAIVIVPTVLTAIYYGLFAADRYVSEARFAVRSGDRSALDVLAGGTELGKLAQAQDTLVVTEYVRSRSLVEALQHDLDLRKMYSRDEADIVSALSADASIEDTVDYWRSRATTSVEMPSGIITLQVSAFTPDDAQKLALAVVAHSEALVNEMSARANRDELNQAEAEFARAEQKLKDVYGAMRDLRNREGVLDPEMSAAALNELLTELRKQRLQIQGDLIVARKSMRADSPVVRQLEAKLAAVDGQIEKVNAEMTANGAASGALSDQMGAFEDMELKRQVAQDQYAAAALALENARVTADRQRIYLSTFVKPELAEEAIYPLRLWSTLAVALGLLVAWSAIASLARIARNATA